MNDKIFTFDEYLEANEPNRDNMYDYIGILLQNDNINEVVFNLDYANLYNPKIEQTSKGSIIYHDRFMPKGILVLDEILPDHLSKKEKERFGSDILLCWRLKAGYDNFYELHILENNQTLLAPEYMDMASIVDAIGDYFIREQEACQALSIAYKELLYPEFLVIDDRVYIKEQYKTRHPANKDKMFWVNLVYVENFFYDDEYYSEDHTIEFANKIVECWNKKLKTERLDALAKAIMIDDEEDGVFVSIVPVS